MLRAHLVQGRDPLKFGMEGPDVFAAQRALRAAHCRKHKASYAFGFRCRRNVRRFQKTHNLKRTGRINDATMKKLSQYYDGYGLWLIKQQEKKTAAATKVHESVKVAFFLLAHKDQTHYTLDPELRGEAIAHRIRPPSVPRWLDCSAACHWYRWVAGLSDMSGNDYRYTGNTTSAQEHGSRVTGQVIEGDMTFYSNPDHMVIEVGQGYCISNGSESAPFYLHSNYRPKVQTKRYGGSYG